MSTADRAELDSAQHTLDDLIERTAAMAQRYADGNDESLAADLYEVERALQVASRRLGVVIQRV